MEADDLLAGNSRTRTLQRAVDALGSVPQLADHLDVPLNALEEWLASTQPMPHEVFSRALDIVAAGPFRVRGTIASARRSAADAKRAQAHADRMLDLAAQLQNGADRAQVIADRAQREADAASDVADVTRILEDSRKAAKRC